MSPKKGKNVKISCLKSLLLGSRLLLDLESELPLQGFKKTVITGLRKKNSHVNL
jgi:hypothetical protein